MFRRSKSLLKTYFIYFIFALLVNNNCTIFYATIYSVNISFTGELLELMMNRLNKYVQKMNDKIKCKNIHKGVGTHQSVEGRQTLETV